MWIIGLTGSIAMGKSTVAQMCVKHGCAHFDADATVHHLYETEAVAWFTQHFPHVVTDGIVNRMVLSDHLKHQPDDLQQIEAYIHPLLWAKKQQSFQQAVKNNVTALVYDIPILFEKNQQNTVDIRLTVSAGDKIQRQRALSRPHMTAEKFEFIKARQWEDAKKRQASHITIPTDCSLRATENHVITLLNLLKGR